MKRNGAEMIVESLRREGVDTVFGYPGGAVIPIFDALYHSRDIRVVLARHEQAAVHAADGYARATGKAGVCVVTSGPGATNTVTGLATARLDSVPLVCITGQVSRPLIGNDVFQEADTVGITQPVTKHNYLVMSREELGTTLKRSFYIAESGRPGPVVVDIPKDVLLESFDDEYPDSVELRGYKPAGRASAESLAALADAIGAAEKPLFFIGGGVVMADASGALKKIIESTGIPVVTSLMGIGALDSAHPLNLGMLGMHGDIGANKALCACDLLVGLGVRFDDRAVGDATRFAPLAKIAHVDIDPTSIGRTMRADIQVVGDLRTVLDDLAERLGPQPDRAAWIAETAGYAEYGESVVEAAESRKPKELPTPMQVMKTINKVIPEALIVTEVGQNQMWAAQYLRIERPRRWLTSGGLGTMGYGFPAALGAQAAKPRDTVVVVAGDGSFQMNIQELATSVQEELPVIVVILNNGYLGMVRQWQELFFDKRYSAVCLDRHGGCPADCSAPKPGCSAHSPDFAAIAAAYSAVGYRASTPRELEEALTAALETRLVCRRPTVIDCKIGREENVWPIVAPGKGNDQMLYEGVLV